MFDPLQKASREPYNRVLDITPVLSASWLEKNDGNRPINWSYVSQLARDMRAGRFVLTHQGIAFDTEGKLIDGQHRLWAILEAEVTVPMRVFFNESPQNVVFIDGNNPRKAAHRMSLDQSLGTVRDDELHTLRAMLGGIHLPTKRRSLHEEMELLSQHRDAVRFAHEHLLSTRPAGLALATTRAVVARASYCVPRDPLLTRFCEVVRNGVSLTQRDQPIVLLRTQLLDLGRRGSTRPIRCRQYALTSRALLAYVQGEVLTVLRPAAHEVFLLPGERQAAG